MKALTHDVFSLGVGSYLVFHLERLPVLPFLLLVVWLAFATNELIDVLGHFARGGIPVRTFWTHSVFTAPIWGIAAAIISTYASAAYFQALALSQNASASSCTRGQRA